MTTSPPWYKGGATCKALRMFRGDLAFCSGVAENYLAQLETSGGNASVTVLRKIAEATGPRGEDLLADVIATYSG
jgi:transcriptional regulator with XRE-family HTH domain